MQLDAVMQQFFEASLSQVSSEIYLIIYLERAGLFKVRQSDVLYHVLESFKKLVKH